MSEEFIDRTREVRPGEELDVPKLEAYLRSYLPEMHDPLEIEQFHGGHSNLTYLLRVGEREMVLRRPPFGAKIKTAHDMGREYHILSHLAPVYPRVPLPLAYCEDESVLGAPFYIMERITGVILRNTHPEGLDLSTDVMSRLSQAFIQNLADIHSVDIQEAGLSDFGRPEGYVERQIIGWTERYYNAQTDDIQQIDAAAEWLAQNMPPES